MAAQPDTAKHARPFGDLGVRVLSAAVFGPALLILAWRGDVWFAALISLMSAAGIHEFLGLLRHSGRQPYGSVALAAGIGLPLLLFLGFEESLWAFWIVVLLVTLLAAVRRGSPQDALQDVGTTILAVVYVAGLLGHLVLLRELPEKHGGTHLQGFYVVGFAFASMWVADTGAYLVGSLWGRRRLAPKISPGKSLEGAVGAAVLTAIAGGLFAAFLLPDHLPIWGGVSNPPMIRALDVLSWSPNITGWVISGTARTERVWSPLISSISPKSRESFSTSLTSIVSPVWAT